MGPESLTQYWIDRQIEKDLGLRSVYEKQVLRLLQFFRGKSNLEIGSGSGRWSQTFAHGEYIGIEIDRSAAVFSHKRFKNDIIVADVRFLPIRDDSFDFVFSIGVVEHFPETMLAIAEHMRVCTRDGLILISVPYLFSPFSLPSFIRAFKRRYDGKGYQRYFGSRYGCRNFQNLLESCRFRVLNVRKLGIALPPPLDSWLDFTARVTGAELFFIGQKNSIH
jgi:SAM-dependent methyltransferase